MLTPNHHPHDERLAGLAYGDPDEVADAGLAEHVAVCARCTGMLDELTALRTSLAALPDVPPHRPLRLLPPEPEPGASGGERLSGWVRRLFAPALTAGAALAMVGLVGTAAPALDGAQLAGGGDAGVFSAQEDAEAESEHSADDYAAAEQPGAEIDEPEDGAGRVAGEADATATPLRQEQLTDSLPAERSPWPMVLFTGVALIAGAFLLRWILVPRGG